MQRTSARSKRLSPVLRLAENRERSAALLMAKARQKLNYYEEKLADLHAFREEYSSSLRAMQKAAVSANQLQEYRHFMIQLEEGINVLSKKVNDQKTLNQRDEQQWVNARRRTDALDKLVDKLRGMERRYLENRETDEIDERSQHKRSNI